MFYKKATVKLRRKYTELPVRRNGKWTTQYRVCMKFDAGPLHYTFDHDEAEFEVPAEHAPRLIARCDMEVAPTGKEVIAKAKAAESVEAESKESEESEEEN